MNKNSIINSFLILIIATTLLVVTIVKDSNKDNQNQKTDTTLKNIQEILTPYKDKDNMNKLMIA